jgi:hypothetical protein
VTIRSEQIEHSSWHESEPEHLEGTRAAAILGQHSVDDILEGEIEAMNNNLMS